VPYAVARVGGDVYEREQFSNTWSVVASLGSAGTSAWRGLALTRTAAGARTYFTQATIGGGASGVLEQSWPNSIPASASAATVVYAATDVIPFGASDDGCELYAAQTTASGLTLLLLHR
jgi:hypothetical protein